MVRSSAWMKVMEGFLPCLFFYRIVFYKESPGKISKVGFLNVIPSEISIFRIFLIIDSIETGSSYVAGISVAHRVMEFSDFYDSFISI
jgi:hypothetical protein